MKKFIAKILKFIYFIKIKIYYYFKNNTKIYSYHIDKNLNLGRNCIINKGCYIGKNVEIGDYTYLNSAGTVIEIDSNVKIGKFCSIGPNVFIGQGNHPTEYITTHPIIYDNYYQNTLKINKENRLVQKMPDDERITTIGNDVWIGIGSIIKRGIKIGDGVIIAAGSIVTKDIPNYAIVGGVPAKVIRYRFNEEQIQNLMKNRWWQWEESDIRKNFKSLYDYNEYIKL